MKVKLQTIAFSQSALLTKSFQSSFETSGNIRISVALIITVKFLEQTVFFIVPPLSSLLSGVSKTQTSKTQTPDPKNSDLLVSRKLRPGKNSDPEKTQTLGCLENSDPKNSDPWMSRKLRPEKLRPSGCLENSDPKNKTYLHRVNAASRLVYCSSIRWHYDNLPRKEKQFIVS